jgi:hypothetical protein
VLGRGRIERRRRRRVAALPAHRILQLLDLVLECRELALQFGYFTLQSQDHGLGLRREAVPEMCRQWRPCTHSGAIGNYSPLGNPEP